MNPEAGRVHRKLVGALVAATHNSGKLREFGELLAPYGIEVVSAGALGLAEPEETGDTFEANAKLKAFAAARAAGQPALADDSGLCVEALGDAPGIYSARWAGGSKDFSGAMARVEQELRARGAPEPWRAHFISGLALVWPDDHVEYFEGRVDGRLVFPPKGGNGFGYDPIFVMDGMTQTFGELDPAHKHSISHRAKAFAKLLNSGLFK